MEELHPPRTSNLLGTVNNEEMRVSGPTPFQDLTLAGRVAGVAGTKHLATAPDVGVCM